MFRTARPGASVSRCRPRRSVRPNRRGPRWHATAASLINAVRNAATIEPRRNSLDKAVELFDLGIALRAQQRYAEALEGRQQALNLAPENLVYQASVQRLRAQLRVRSD
jgi:tetratricopeptide (TPR) repeat protein